MISIVTGTLERLEFLPDLIKNTVDSHEKLELVLIDGGELNNSTSAYIKQLNHPRIKLIEVGGRSSYPDFMKLGIEHATHELVCQWNDDVLLVNSWDDVISEIEDGYDFYLFNWKYGHRTDVSDDDWITGRYHENQKNKGWCIVDEYDTIGEVEQLLTNFTITNEDLRKNKYKYSQEELERNINGLRFLTILHTQKVNGQFIAKYILNDDYNEWPFFQDINYIPLCGLMPYAYNQINVLLWTYLNRHNNI